MNTTCCGCGLLAREGFTAFCEPCFSERADLLVGICPSCGGDRTVEPSGVDLLCRACGWNGPATLREGFVAITCAGGVA